MKFGHISDTHIRNFKYHKEYRAIFQQIYDELKKEKVDAIVHCGDLAHTKTQLSPEYFDLATDFLRSLADIAPLIIIAGNHDGNLKNSHRQDAISPIVSALCHPNIHYRKNAGEYSLNEKVTFNVLSVFDEDNWVKPTDQSKINIALYHGAVSGVKTDMDYVMEHGDHNVDIFGDHDFAFLGDIHKTNQIVDTEGRCRYPGSTVQQNFGETNDKGFLIWDIQSKDKFTCKHFPLVNPKPFVSITLTPKGRLPRKLTVPLGSRIRLVSETNISLDVIKRSVDIAKHRFKPESVSYLNRASNRGGHSTSAASVEHLNLRDPAIQERLIREFLTNYEAEESLIVEVLELNKKYAKLAEEDEEISRNINWEINDLEWDALFNYGKGNTIDFTKLNGIVGLFGKNFSGKSSVVDSLLYTVFNTTSKNERKNLNVINQDHNEGSGTVSISIGKDKYYISRTSTKYVKKLKGEETLEAKTELDFYKIDKDGEVISLNGLTRNDTDKNIRKIFGSSDDFMYTSMSSQLDSLSFIREGSTKRKEILAKFLDLEIFEKKFKLAKENSVDIRGALRRLEDRDYKEEIEEIEKEIAQKAAATVYQESLCAEHKTLLEKVKNELSELEQKIDNAPAKIIDIHSIRNDIKSAEKTVFSLKSQNENYEQDVEILEENLLITKKSISEIDHTELYRKLEILDARNAAWETMQDEILELEESLERKKRKKKILTQVPCGDSFPTCKFIRDAVVAEAHIPDIEKSIHTKAIKMGEMAVELFKEEDPRGKIGLYETLIDNEARTEKSLSTRRLEIERNISKILQLNMSLKELKNEEQEYEINKEVIENYEALVATKKVLSIQSRDYQGNLESCDKEIMKLHREGGSLNQKLENIKELKNEYLSLRKEYAAYDLFTRCMHSNGIAYDIIKKNLPILNQEIAKILANLTEFEVFFEEDGSRLDIYIKHPKYAPRALSMASGAEKTMAAMAIRLALLTISSLPTSNVMVLDEPGVFLDEEHLQAFTQMLEMIKTKFKIVILISHLESLKDVADMTIDITKKSGYASIQQ